MGIRYIIFVYIYKFYVTPDIYKDASWYCHAAGHHRRLFFPELVILLNLHINQRILIILIPQDKVIYVYKQ